VHAASHWVDHPARFSVSPPLHEAGGVSRFTVSAASCFSVSGVSAISVVWRGSANRRRVRRMGGLAKMSAPIIMRPLRARPKATSTTKTLQQRCNVVAWTRRLARIPVAFLYRCGDIVADQVIRPGAV